MNREKNIVKYGVALHCCNAIGKETKTNRTKPNHAEYKWANQLKYNNVQCLGDSPSYLHANVTLLMLFLEHWTVDHQKWKKLKINRKSLFNFFIAPRWKCMRYAWQAMWSCSGMNAPQTKCYIAIDTFRILFLKSFLNATFDLRDFYVISFSPVQFRSIQFHSAKWTL